MRRLDLSLPTAAENLALDEALLNRAERGQSSATGDDGEILRLWEPISPAVVVGSGSKIAEEVRETECQQRQVPVLRRISGGAAVVTGPGCLMYSLVLDHQRRELPAIGTIHRFVLGHLAKALAGIDASIAHRGTSDLAVGEYKFSGNSVRIKRRHLLYHGTILYDFPLGLIADCLWPPPRQPAYRQGREHQRFVANLSAPAEEIRRCLTDAWDAHTATQYWPEDEVAELFAQKYQRRDWNYRR